MVTTDPWVGQGVALHYVPLSALQRLQKGDASGVRDTFPALTSYDAATVPTFVNVWKRRYAQVLENPGDAPWVTRLMILASTNEIVGRAGFHGMPDENGMVEVGYEIAPEHRRKGYATEAVKVMIETARSDPSVTVVRATVQPTNTSSSNIVIGMGFEKTGEQIDDEDGLEYIYELPLSK